MCVVRLSCRILKAWSTRVKLYHSGAKQIPASISRFEEQYIAGNLEIMLDELREFVRF